MKLYIASVQPVKSGIKDGRKWTLYHVVDPQGTRYATFNEKYVGMVGQEVDVQIEERASDKVNPQTGQPYINRTILEQRRSPSHSGSAAFEKRAIELLEGINKKLDNLAVESDQVVGIGEIGEPNLPF